MDSNKRWNWGWVSSAILLIVYAVVVTSFVVANDTNTNRNKADIEKQERIHREDFDRLNKTIQEGFKELREQIRDSK